VSPARRLAGPAGVAGLAVAVVAYVGAVDPNVGGHYPTCPFLFVTGWYCPGCGSLRALHALAHLDLATAVARNPFAVAMVPLLVAIWLRWAGRSATGRRRSTAAHPALIWALLGLVVVFWVLRNLPGFGWLAP
jgi:hypothetical protein